APASRLRRHSAAPAIRATAAASATLRPPGKFPAAARDYALPPAIATTASTPLLVGQSGTQIGEPLRHAERIIQIGLQQYTPFVASPLARRTTQQRFEILDAIAPAE